MRQNHSVFAVVMAIVSAAILLIAALLNTVLGIFFTDGDAIRDVIESLNQELEEEIQAIVGDVPHDDLDVSDIQTDWVSTLAVYSVRIAADPDNAQDLLTVDSYREEILRQTFWDMHFIYWETEIYEIPAPELPEETVPAETQPVETTPEETEPVETSPVETEPDETEPVQPSHPPIPEIRPLSLAGYSITATAAAETPMIEQIRLRVYTAYRSADEIAAQYNFTEEQLEQLEELLRPENAALWEILIYGTGSPTDPTS